MTPPPELVQIDRVERLAGPGERTVTNRELAARDQDARAIHEPNGDDEQGQQGEEREATRADRVADDQGRERQPREKTRAAE